jgi:iron complex outermembrane receptor protein
VVTGAWEPIPLEEADRTVETLPVRAAPLLFNSLAAFLRLAPTLDLRERAGNGVQADLSIRGAAFGQTLVLLNGRRLNDPQSGHHALDLPVPLDAVERIEVLAGAGSTLYGADALGGAVNVVVRPPEATSVRLRAAAGNDGAQQQAVALAGVRGPAAGQLTLSRDFSRGFMPDRDYRSLAAAAGGTLRSRYGVSGLDLGYADKPFGAAGFYGNFESWERTRTWFAAGRHSFAERTTADFSYRRHSDQFILWRYRPQVYDNRHFSESWHGSLRRRQPLGGNATLYLGGEGFGESLASTNLGDHSRARGAAYTAFDLRALGRFSLNAGLRAEAPGTLAPSVSGGWWLAPRLRLRAAVSRAFRIPSYTELYYHDPANLGSPNLRPERSWSYETGAAWRFLDATVFHRRDRDVIDYARRSAAEIWRAANVQALDFTGLEAAARWRTFSLAYTGIRAAQAPTPNLESKYAFNYARHAGVASWQGRLPRQWNARTRVGALVRRGGEPYAVWDAAIARAVGRVRPFAQVSNLTATRYEETPGLRMPGRMLLVGFELRLR